MSTSHRQRSGHAPLAFLVWMVASNFDLNRHWRLGMLVSLGGSMRCALDGGDITECG
jgi:hypothetical protein